MLLVRYNFANYLLNGVSPDQFKVFNRKLVGSSSKRREFVEKQRDTTAIEWSPREQLKQRIASTGAAGEADADLIKSLQVNMLVKDTRQAASDLQSWIATTDPRSTSAGIDYEQTYDNLYNVTMTFSVTSTQYTQIEEYLAGYAQQRGGKLTSLHESVQDVTNDYIDTQSRLTNLRGEQQRLLTAVSQALRLLWKYTENPIRKRIVKKTS